MNKIDVNDLKECIDSIEKFQSQFKKANIGFFKTMEQTADFWQDNRANVFYNALTKEKVINRKLRNNIEKHIAIYQYVYNEYRKFGDKIEYETDKKEAIFIKLNNGIEQIEVIIKKFNSLNVDFSFGQKSLLLEQKTKLLKLLELWHEYRDSLKKFFDQVDKIELDVKKKIGDIDIIKIDETVID